MDIDRSPPSRGGSMGGMDATDDDKEDWGRLNDIIESIETLLATLRWLRQIQANDLEDNKENTNGNGVLKAIFDILRKCTDGDDAAIRTLSQQASGDMYRALELAALMSSPSPTPYTHEDDDESLYYMDWTEKTMINTADGGDEAYPRASNGIHPLPSRRLLVKEGILMQLSGSNTTSEGALSDDDRAWLGYLSGHLSTLLSTKDCWMGSEAPIRSSSLSPLMHAAATDTSSEFGGYLATLYRQELLPYHHQELTSNVVDALFDGLIRAKLEVEDDMKYDATASTIMGDHILDEHTLTVFKDRVINASSHIEIIKGTSAQVPNN
ncbi:hypothetical protein Pmar_PMAR025365 [Perkinsus marinus ATCC 50983]|uniref:Uncharacterized protein n=1 Tax=Perkinsus marinus (strain ATCC 50983 / TXsc) TaxID=423536 RepID=C5KS40_PERM5|nr:hypothetical protein Pmar_PMAR025365 [Perkinsus marinus ATCC 50983]EER12731.1 hypothetical protein Pmar_PMAR025365 [Perkinsus marinus ATCC 50983]|eukprot:XP_002780936.1 hypothetical protein Pmar_PMAR025365 [Perkinsus marinus ATCC 50983]